MFDSTWQMWQYVFPVREYSLVERIMQPAGKHAVRYATGKLQYGCIPTECPQQGGIQLLPSCIPYGKGTILFGCSVRNKILVEKDMYEP